MNCVFCKIITDHTERLLRQTEHTFTVLSNPRLMPGHVLIIPKRHVEKFGDLTPEEKNEICNEISAIEDIILKHIADGCDFSQHYRPFIEDNQYKVSHLHIHIKPRALYDELYEKSEQFQINIFKNLPPEEIEKFSGLYAR